MELSSKQAIQKCCHTFVDNCYVVFAIFLVIFSSVRKEKKRGRRFDFHIIHIHIFHYHRVYHELTIDHVSMWLGSSVDRALHRSQGHGFESSSILTFFQLLIKLIAHCQDQISLI